MKAVLCAFCLLCAVPAFAQHPDRTAVVAQVKADLLARGFDLSSPNDAKPCNVFAITKRVAWIVRADGVGYIKKGGNNCEGFSVDALMYKDGTVVDLLVGSGETNGPQWSVTGTRPVTDWAQPVDPGDGQPPPPQPPDLTAVLLRVMALEAQTAKIAPLAAKVDGLVHEVGSVETALNALTVRVNELVAKPIPTTCIASVNLGFRVPISCRLQ